MGKKTKMKIGLCIWLSAAGLAAGFFIAGYLNLLLTGGKLDDVAALSPSAILQSLMADRRHLLLTLSVELAVMVGVSILLTMSRRNTFEADTAIVAGVETPVAVGQGQHGTARWLRPDEKKKVFGSFTLTEGYERFALLEKQGEEDKRKVRRARDVDSENRDGPETG
jgi:type IV secretion system protein VirD4